MEDNKKSLGDMTQEEKVKQGIPVDSSQEPIEHTAPTKAFEEDTPADISPDEVGKEKLGAANAIADIEKGINAKTGDPVQQAEADISGEKPGGFKNKVWKPFLWPVVTLMAICVVMSALLAATNQVTAPLIAAHAEGAANEARYELLPAANGFDDITPADAPSGITGLHRATNGVGYTVEASANGYGGQVPVMVAFDNDGTIIAVAFLQNEETVGIGDKISTEGWFGEQFEGQSGSVQADTVTGATISSTAAITAIKNAVELFSVEVLGNEASASAAPSADDLMAALLPEADSFTEVAVSASGVTAAYAAANGTGFVIEAYGDGYVGDVPALVAFDADGTVVGVAFPENGETPGLGTRVAEEDDFAQQFVGMQGTVNGVDAISGVTVTSNAAADAVQNAMDAFDEVKGA